MSFPRPPTVIALVVAAGLAALVWSCAGRIAGGHIWTPWGHAEVTNAEWGSRTSELAGFHEGGTNAASTAQPPAQPLPPLTK